MDPKATGSCPGGKNTRLFIIWPPLIPSPAPPLPPSTPSYLCGACDCSLVPLPLTASLPLPGMRGHPVPSLASVALMPLLGSPGPPDGSGVPPAYFRLTLSLPWAWAWARSAQMVCLRTESRSYAPRAWQAGEFVKCLLYLEKTNHISSFSVFTKPLPRMPLTFLNQCAPLPSIGNRAWKLPKGQREEHLAHSTPMN